MQQMINNMGELELAILVGIMGIIVFLLISIIYLLISNSKLKKKMDMISNKKNGKSLEEIVHGYYEKVKEIDDNQKDVLNKVSENQKSVLNKVNENQKSVLNKIDITKNELSTQINDIQEAQKFCIQKVEMIRYSAFDDVGGDLSYSIVLLDANNDGMVLTNIFGRNQSYSYSKSIKNGKSEHVLSEQEEVVLEKVLKK